jgi:porin
MGADAEATARGAPRASNEHDGRRPYGIREIIRSASLRLIVAAGAPALAGCAVARANDAANAQSSAIAPSPAPPEISSQSSSHASLPELLKRMTDPGDLRTRLEQEGIQFTFTYYGDLFANASGGVKRGPGYDGRFGTIIDADLEKLAGWSGAKFHASFHQIHGSEFSAGNLENLMTVSGIEAQPSTRLFNLWIEQKLGSYGNLRVGQFTAAQEFLVSQNANLFVNSTFGWPVLNAQDLPSGGPAYPEATPGVRLAFTPNEQLTVRAAIFNGDPAGPGAGNPVERDPAHATKAALRHDPALERADPTRTILVLIPRPAGWRAAGDAGSAPGNAAELSWLK